MRHKEKRLKDFKLNYNGKTFDNITFWVKNLMFLDRKILRAKKIFDVRF